MIPRALRALSETQLSIFLE